MPLSYRRPPLILLFIIIITGLTCLALTPAAQASDTMPEHNLSVAFDLSTGLLTAASRIKLPAGKEIRLVLSGLTMIKVMVNGEDASINLDGIYVPPAPVDQEILIFYEKIIQDDDHVGADGIFLTSGWHPVADHDMIFKLHAVIPSEFSAVSEADEIITFPKGPEPGKKQIVFRFPHPLKNIHLIAANYVVEKDVLIDGKILVSYFFAEDSNLAKSYRDKARQYIERYEKLIGPYPYSRFSIVENRNPTGYAMPTFTLLGQDVVRLPFITDTSLGHEVLHQWFGNSVRTSAAEGNWAEGLATYLADHAYAADKGEDAAYRKDLLIKYASFVHDADTSSLWDFSGAGHSHADRAKQAIGYGKSALFFHMLKNKVGAEKFNESLRHFFQKMRDQEAGWSDILESFEETTQAELDGFFDQWLTRTDIPEISVSTMNVNQGEGRPRFSFTLVQHNDPPYEMIVPVTIRTADETIHKTVHISEKETTEEILLTRPPIDLVVDDSHDLIRKLSPAEIPPTWSRFMGAGKKAAIVANDEAAEIFAPLIAILEETGCRIINEKDVQNSDLNDSAVIFLGTDGATSRSLFARTNHQAGGFTLDVRRHPLHKNLVAVLVTAPNRKEVALAAPKLSHYGKYSHLFLAQGQIRTKQIAESEDGQMTVISTLPDGIATNAPQSFAKIMEKLRLYQVVYVGELHTNYEDHKLQLEIIRALYDHNPNLAIGMEMFTRPTQQALDDFLAGRIEEKAFLKQSGYFKIWQFDYRLYREIINFAKQHQIPIIALNLDKEIVSSVYRDGGTASLEAETKAKIPADRDLDLPGYSDRLTGVHDIHLQPNQADRPFSGFIQAQALWDETMAETAAEYLQANPKKQLVILAGHGHVDKNTAIPPRVLRRIPVVQAVVLNGNGGEADPATADFIFFSPSAGLSKAPLLGVMLMDTDKKGATVSEVNPQGSAALAGIRKDDIILSVDDEPVSSIEDIKIEMLYKENKKSVRVKIRRERFLLPDRIMEFEVDLNPAQAAHQ